MAGFTFTVSPADAVAEVIVVAQVAGSTITTADAVAGFEDETSGGVRVVLGAATGVRLGLGGTHDDNQVWAQVG